MIKYFTIEDLLKHYLQKKFHILDLVYRNFSEYVHLAEKAFYSSVTTSSSEQYDIEFSVGLPLKEKANPVLLEVANAFVYYVKLQNNLVNQIVISKAGW